MVKIEYSDSEVATLRFLADRFREGWSYLGLADLPCHSEIGYVETHNRVNKFLTHGLVSLGEAVDLYTISPQVVALIDAIDNPPPRDYWKEWTVWFRGRKWSLPVLVIVIGLPAVVQWVDMLRAVLGWLGVMG